MFEKIKTIASILVIIVCLPYLITFILQGDFLNDVDGTLAQTQEKDMDLLVRILAGQVPLNYEEEAIKAQAVIARTNLQYARKNNQPETEGIAEEELRKLWAEDYQKNYQRLRSCVESTAGEVLKYKKKIIQLPYHAVSAGKTRDAEELGNKKLKYLKSVTCSKDLKSEQFLRITWLKKKQYLNKLKQAYPDVDFSEKDVESAAAVKERDSADYVITIELPDRTVSGEEFARAMSLPSACFSIKEIDGQVRIVTKGYGHGLGMSQFQANEMALEGKEYLEILNYFYDGVTIEK